MPDKTQSVFETLVSINVNGHTDTKETSPGVKLTYLSWPWAWSEVKKRCPDAHYAIQKDPVTHLPYSYDPQTGYMVYTTVTIDGITHEMWLPVMDSNNRAMKSEPYTVKTKYKEIHVAAATMFDVNKAIMRCLVKNLAMFGLGLYIYAGEDLPEQTDEEEVEDTKKKPATKAKPPEPKKQQSPEPPPSDGLRPISADIPGALTPGANSPDSMKFVCEKCGQVLRPYKDANGKEVPIRKHAEGSRAKFGGKVFCLDCINAYIGGNKT